MSAERAAYLGFSALLKLVVREPESIALRWYIGPHRPLVSSALVRTEVVRALGPLGADGFQRGRDVLARMELLRIRDRVLMQPGPCRRTSCARSTPSTLRAPSGSDRTSVRW